jgi:hypothetical protein
MSYRLVSNFNLLTDKITRYLFPAAMKRLCVRQEVKLRVQRAAAYDWLSEASQTHGHSV